MDIFRNIGDSAGGICRAVICVRKPSDAANGTASKSNKLQDEILDAAKEKLSKNGTSSYSNLGYKDIKALAEQNGYSAIGVKYNPATVSYTSEGGGKTRNRSQMGSAGENMMYNSFRPKKVSLSFKLVFEDINVHDSFINNFETLNTNFGDIASLGSSVTKKIMKKNSTGFDEPYSVRKYLEGFISLLLHQETRDVIFFWGKNCFHGVLTEVTSSYKMFNKVGAPVLGEVDIKITQYNNPSDNQTDPNYKQWENAYINVFGREEDWDAATGSSVGFDNIMANIDKYTGMF